MAIFHKILGILYIEQYVCIYIALNFIGILKNFVKHYVLYTSNTLSTHKFYIHTHIHIHIIHTHV